MMEEIWTWKDYDTCCKSGYALDVRGEGKVVLLLYVVGHGKSLHQLD